MMRAWRSTFHVGGVFAALALSSMLGALGALGCVSASDEPEEAMGVAESALSPDGPDVDVEDDAALDDPIDGELTEPEPHPWRPPPALWAAGGVGAPDPEDTDPEPEPHPWHPAVDASNDLVRPDATP